MAASVGSNTWSLDCEESFASERSLFARDDRLGIAPSTTKVQPESRVQTRFVGQRWKMTLSLRVLALARTLRACFSDAVLLTIRSMRSCRPRWRMISAYTQGMGSNLPGQSLR